MEKLNRYVRLSRKDVAPGIERKGQLDFLSWAYAWNLVSEEYPDANFYYADPVFFQDGTCMVKAVCTVDGKTMEQTLPVMNHKNAAIPNPDARAISDAQQRALVKCLALYGVGISLYLGKVKGVLEESPFDVVSRLIDSGDHSKFHEYVTGLDERTRTDLFNEAPAGQKTKFKDAYRGALKHANLFFDSVSETVSEARESDDTDLLLETIGELTGYEKNAVWARLGAEDQQFIQTTRK